MRPAGENGLQRGERATATAGTVLSAVRVLVRRTLHDMIAEGSLSGFAKGTLLGHFTKGNGVGEPDIYAFLHAPPAPLCGLWRALGHSSQVASKMSIVDAIASTYVSTLRSILAFFSTLTTP